ncbi:MAG TPA: VWA domain-containing protein, partial [Vicinamibacteria bacterium]|nr:VWA domain-containing protein [Vicinamibacteria bacterium]
MLFLALLAGPAAFAQEVPATGAELVRLDVVVTDAQGRLVRDLTREDFLVLEDGKPQQLTHFVATGPVAATVPAPQPGAPAPPGAAATAEARPGRTIVLVVDDLHIAGTNMEMVKVGLRRVVDELAAPGDEVALVTTGAAVLVQPTTGRAALRQAIGGLTSRAAVVVPAPGSQMTPAQAELILARERNALQLAARTLVNEPGSVFDGASPQVALEAGGGQVAVGGSVDSEARERVAEREAERQARAVLADALRFSGSTLKTVADVIQSLAPLPGRKLCLLVSDGFLLGTGTTEERTADVRRIFDAATRAGAVLYALDSRGLTTATADAGVAGTGVTPGLQARVDRQGDQLFRNTLSSLADGTGGFLVRGTNDLAAGVGRM